MAVVRRTSILKSNDGGIRSSPPPMDNPSLPPSRHARSVAAAAASTMTSDDSSQNTPSSLSHRQRRKRCISWCLSSIRPISLITSHWRTILPSTKLIHQLQTNIKRHPVLFGILVLIVLYRTIIVLFGPRGSIKGGSIGIMYDQIIRDYTRYETVSKWRNEVRSELRIPIIYHKDADDGALLEPTFWPLDVIITTRPNNAIVEMLLREKRRVRILNTLVDIVNKTTTQCLHDMSIPIFIPTSVLQILPHHEQPELPPYWIARSDVIDLQFVAVHNSDVDNIVLSSSMDMKDCQNINKYSDLHCLSYTLGGIRLGDSISLYKSRSQIEAIFDLMRQSKIDPPMATLGGGNCNSRAGYAIFSNIPTPDDQLRKSAISSRVGTTFAAFPPNHIGNLCIPPFVKTVGISPYNEINKVLSYQSIFINKLITEIESKDFRSTTSVWGIATLTCDFGNGSADVIADCCDRVSVSVLDSIDGGDIVRHIENEQEILQKNNEQSHYIIFTSSKVIAPEKEINVLNPLGMVSVKINEHTDDNAEPNHHPKMPIQFALRNVHRCEPSWFCNRCLQSSRKGSFSKCASTCGDCAINAICGEGERGSSRVVKINVEVADHAYPRATTGEDLASFFAARQRRIPRIIHQTYFEELTIDKYPQLVRLQNTWKASGWEYRFYNDDSARQYIETNYPPRFVTAFDTLLPGAYKADLFRYLVLFQEGGIYVDVDVMLNTNLDTFFTPDLAFFAPIDAVGSFADEQFCLWNGLLGSAPAHPILAKVIEWMVNLVSTRADMYDMERTVCELSGVDHIENWKVRTEPLLMLSGPCALGLALNYAVGNEPLTKFSPGILTRDGYNRKKFKDLDSDAIGNVMILSVCDLIHALCRCSFFHPLSFVDLIG